MIFKFYEGHKYFNNHAKYYSRFDVLGEPFFNEGMKTFLIFLLFWVESPLGSTRCPNLNRMKFRIL
jgi:hypothetical protein